MSTRPQESLKEPANQLARLIVEYSEDRAKMMQLAKELGIITPEEGTLGNRHAPETRDTQSPHHNAGILPQTKKVGIWIPRVIDGETYYVRDISCKGDFEQWARVHEIPPKGSKKRIIFTGESVARGFLLDPFFTPALALEHFLNIPPHLLQAEVIDLARNNIGMVDLEKLVTSSLLLKPDVLVLFAGNNWLKDVILADGEIDEMIEIIKGDRDFSRLKELLEAKHKEKVIRFIEFLHNFSKLHGIPIVYIIPEFNLADFRSMSLTQLLPWPKGETGPWRELKEEAEAALDNGEMEKVESLSRRMIKLNEGNPLGYEMIGYSKLKQGAYVEAEEWLRQALDTAIFRLSGVPLSISVIRRTLRQETARCNIPVVDLPEVLRHHNSGKPPGRRFFLDYCHLTVEGINLAMAVTAQRVFSLSIGKDVPLQGLMEKRKVVDPDVEARSHLFAAVHNAHRGDQSYEILNYHCLQALKIHRPAANLMKIYCDMASRHIVWSLGKNCEQLVQSGQLDQFPGLLQPHDHYLMDIALVDAMADALKTAGVDIKEEIDRLRKEEHGLKYGKKDLLESYYHLTSYMMNPRPGGNYYRAVDPVSVFYLVTEKNRNVVLNLTFRVPRENSGKRIGIKVNGAVTAELPADETWKNETIEISGKYLNDGINTIIIRWPTEISCEKDRRSQYFANNPSQFLRMIMYPVYGEIHAFTAR